MYEMCMYVKNFYSYLIDTFIPKETFDILL